MVKGKIPITIFLDLSKAFDTLNHDILYTALSYYVVKGLSSKLIQSYLPNRKQFIEINDTKSDMSPISTGHNTAQVVVSGIVIFAIYTITNCC